MRFELTTHCLEGSDPGDVGVSFESGVPRSCDRVGEFGKAAALGLILILASFRSKQSANTAAFSLFEFAAPVAKAIMPSIIVITGS